MDELETLIQWLQEGRKVALATVVRTWRSAPRPVGSHLIIDENANFGGSVSGGCIEGAVISEALTVINDGKPKLLDFGVSDEMAWDAGLTCGGAIQVYVERIERSTDCEEVRDTASIRAAWIEKKPVALITELNTGQRVLLSSPCEQKGELSLNAVELMRAEALLQSAGCGLIESERENVQFFVRSYVPATRLVIVGAVHIAQHLVVMARQLCFRTVVLDPRRAFATKERFPDVDLWHDWPDEGLKALQIDAHTALVVLSHDPKIDDPALGIALNSPAFYIGALGSNRSHQKRIERLRKRGFEAELDRISAPVGLDIGGRSAAEIALSIMAELVGKYHGKSLS